jgi:hypothetical protein
LAKEAARNYGIDGVWPHGLRDARDLLSASGADGADEEGYCRDSQLRSSGHVLGGDAGSDRELCDAGCGKRRYKVAAENIFVFMHTNKFNNDPFTELLPETIRQPALWGELDREKRERAWKAMDKLNATLGRDTVRIFGAGSKESAWKLRAEYRSPRWTTRWNELPHVNAKGPGVLFSSDQVI